MREAIEHVVKLALEHWKSGTVGEAWKEGLWEVTPEQTWSVSWIARYGADRPRTRREGETGQWQSRFTTARGLSISVQGPKRNIDAVGSPDEGSSGLTYPVDLYPRAYVPRSLDEAEQDRLRHDRAQDRLLPRVMPFSCTLYWPGPRHAAEWIRAQLSIWFLQREWVCTEEDEARVWAECLCPVFYLWKTGREGVRKGLVGPDTLSVVVKRYVNPSWPGGFQSYMVTLVKRAMIHQFKTKKASESDDTSDASLRQRKRERYMAFGRQRYQRGQVRMVKIRGRLHIYPDVGDKLQSEWNAIQARRLFVRAVAARMVQRGALEESAKRQIRRWLRETGSKKGALERVRAWCI